MLEVGSSNLPAYKSWAVATTAAQAWEARAGRAWAPACAASSARCPLTAGDSDASVIDIMYILYKCFITSSVSHQVVSSSFLFSKHIPIHC